MVRRARAHYHSFSGPEADGPGSDAGPCPG